MRIVPKLCNYGGRKMDKDKKGLFGSVGSNMLRVVKAILFA
jgi:hypothetical protein